MLNKRNDPSAALLADVACEYSLAVAGEGKGESAGFIYFHCCSSARIYGSADTLASGFGYWVRPTFFSDDCLVSLQMGRYSRSILHPRWELWKMNNCLLSDQLFQSAVSTYLTHGQGANSQFLKMGFV